MDDVKLAKHTPGPWKVRRNGAGGWSIDPARGMGVARTGPWCREAEANARLLSASPDLLTACKAWIDYLADPDAGDDRTEDVLLAAMRAAIAKAEDPSHG